MSARSPRVLVDGVCFQNALQRGVQRSCLEVLERCGDRARPTLLLWWRPKAPLPRSVPVRVALRPPRRLRWLPLVGGLEARQPEIGRAHV